MTSSAEADYYRLRTEWLRFKSQLVDRLTGLPTLPAVLEEVRRLLEQRSSLDVLYLDLGRSGWHETRLGWAEYDEAVRDFAHLLASLRESGDLDPRDVICLDTVRSDRFLVFRASPLEASSAEAAANPLERVLTALKSRNGSPRLPGAALRLSVGWSRIREDPMVRAERAIQQAVADAMVRSLQEREGIDSARRSELTRMIAESRIRTVFHPIVKLKDGGVIGHEALTRPLGQCGFESVEELFSFAETTELLVDFERLCRTTAIRSVRSVTNRGLLFLNASARAVEDPDWSAAGLELLTQSGLTPRDVVVEITERVAVVRNGAFAAAVRSFKERGYRVAVDDMGAGYASLQALAEIEPDFLKFDTSLVRGIDKSSIKRSLLESLSALAEKIRARVIAEGVEHEEQRLTLLGLGIELGQGFLFHTEA